MRMHSGFSPESFIPVAIGRQRMQINGNVTVRPFIRPAREGGREGTKWKDVSLFLLFPSFLLVFYAQ